MHCGGAAPVVRYWWEAGKEEQGKCRQPIPQGLKPKHNQADECRS
jgi:hypothetical protein